MDNICIVCGKAIPLDHACMFTTKGKPICLHHEGTEELEKAIKDLEDENIKTSYVQIDCKKVKGYEKLSSEQQKLFVETYKIHNSIQGQDYKKEWIPVSISVDAENNHLRVMFKNGEWLYYLPDRTWY